MKIFKKNISPLKWLLIIFAGNLLFRLLLINWYPATYTDSILYMNALDRVRGTIILPAYPFGIHPESDIRRSGPGGTAGFDSGRFSGGAPALRPGPDNLREESGDADRPSLLRLPPYIPLVAADLSPQPLFLLSPRLSLWNI